MTTLPSSKTTTPNAGESNVTLVIIAFVLAVVAVVVNIVAYKNARNEARTAVVTIYRLNKNVEVGEKFQFSKHVEAVTIPEDFKNMDIFRGATDRQTIENKNGAPFQRSASKTTPITLSLFSAADSLLDNLKVPPGKVAATLPINSANAPGFLQEGMFIDVLATVQPEGEQAEVYKVLEQVKVARVGNKEPGKAVASYRSITIIVDSDERMALLYISRFIGGAKGFDIDIRNPSDRATFVGVNQRLLKKLNYRPTAKPEG